MSKYFPTNTVWTMLGALVLPPALAHFLLQPRAQTAKAAAAACEPFQMRPST